MILKKEPTDFEVEVKKLHNINEIYTNHSIQVSTFLFNNKQVRSFMRETNNCKSKGLSKYESPKLSKSMIEINNSSPFRIEKKCSGFAENKAMLYGVDDDSLSTSQN